LFRVLLLQGGRISLDVASSGQTGVSSVRVAVQRGHKAQLRKSSCGSMSLQFLLPKQAHPFRERFDHARQERIGSSQRVGDWLWSWVVVVVVLVVVLVVRYCCSPHRRVLRENAVSAAAPREWSHPPPRRRPFSHPHVRPPSSTSHPPPCALHLCLRQKSGLRASLPLHAVPSMHCPHAPLPILQEMAADWRKGRSPVCVCFPLRLLPHALSPSQTPRTSPRHGSRAA